MNRQKISLIVAIGENGEIGAGNDLLWHLPDDLKYFKSHTMGCPMIMGRRTFESIGRALPGRVSIVISADGIYREKVSGMERCMGASSLEEALLECSNISSDVLPHNDSPFITGGGQIYRMAMEKNLPDVIYLTRVHSSFPQADTFFPIEALENYKCVWSETHAADERNPYSYTYERLERK